MHDKNKGIPLVYEDGDAADSKEESTGIAKTDVRLKMEQGLLMVFQ